MGWGRGTTKGVLQRALGLFEDDDAPLFFWPSRLDTVQKGCQLLAHILYDVVESVLGSTFADRICGGR